MIVFIPIAIGVSVGSGLVVGAAYGLGAAGLSIVYGLSRIQELVTELNDETN